MTQSVFRIPRDSCAEDDTDTTCEIPKSDRDAATDALTGATQADDYVIPRARWSPSILAIVLFGLVPFALFSIWMLTSFNQVGNRDAEARLWCAGTWLLISPGLIVAWEQVRKRTLMSLDVKNGFRPCEIDETTGIADRWRRPILTCVAVVVVFAYMASNDSLSVFLGISHPDGVTYWLGVGTFAWLGVSFGTGFWGVGTAVATIRTAVRPGASITWEPFEPSQVRGMEALSQFAYWTGILFALGGVAFFPILSYVLASENPSLPPAGEIMGIALAFLMLFGGLAVFVLPTVWIQRTAKKQHDRYLRLFVQAIADVENRVLTGMVQAGLSDETRLSALVTLRAAIDGQRAAPGPAWLVTRTAGILALPLLTLAVQRAIGA